MNVSDFKASLPYLFAANVTPFVWGEHGIGKSSIPRQYAEEKGWKFFPFYLGAMSDNGDILGLAEFVKLENGGTATDFAMPKWLADVIEYCNTNPDSGAIILLDEFNRAPKSLHAGMYSFALDKTFHNIKLPKNCHVMAAGNPPTDGYFVTDIDESALMSRFCHIKLEPSFNEWVEYAKTTKVTPSLIEFYKGQPDLLNAKSEPFDMNKIVKPDSRAVSRLDSLLKLNPPQHLAEQFMHGIVGLERTVAYLQFLREQDKPLTGAEVLAKAKPKLVEKWSNAEDVTASCLSLTCENLKEELGKRAETNNNLTDGEKDNLLWFIETVPKDIMYMFIDTIVKTRNPVVKDFMDDGKPHKQRVVDIYREAKGVVKKAV